MSKFSIYMMLPTLASTLAWSCSNKPVAPSQGHEDHRIEEGPARDDLINAVRYSVESKTTVQKSPQRRGVQHSCTQYDVDLDPNAKRNPELARCPRVGAIYETFDTVYVDQAVRCVSLPAPSPAWNVSQLRPDSWRVTYGGSSWIVTKLNGSANNASGIRISSFYFSVVANQAC